MEAVETQSYLATVDLVETLSAEIKTQVFADMSKF
jgi:hypothetical protein